MHHLFLAYGEGQFAQTASGVFLGLLVATSFCLVLIAYASNTYPANRD